MRRWRRQMQRGVRHDASRTSRLDAHDRERWGAPEPAMTAGDFPPGGARCKPITSRRAANGAYLGDLAAAFKRGDGHDGCASAEPLAPGQRSTWSRQIPHRTRSPSARTDRSQFVSRAGFARSVSKVLRHFRNCATYVRSQSRYGRTVAIRPRMRYLFVYGPWSACVCVLPVVTKQQSLGMPQTNR
jgi:hypothetical protein